MASLAKFNPSDHPSLGLREELRTCSAALANLLESAGLALTDNKALEIYAAKRPVVLVQEHAGMFAVDFVESGPKGREIVTRLAEDSDRAAADDLAVQVAALFGPRCVVVPAEENEVGEFEWCRRSADFAKDMAVDPEKGAWAVLRECFNEPAVRVSWIVGAEPEGRVRFDGDAPLAPPDHLIKGILPKAGVAMIGGQSGAGKSFVMVDLTVALATGQDFFGRKVREPVGSLIVAAEGAGTIPARVKAAREYRGVADRLPVAWLDWSTNLADPFVRRDLLTQIAIANKRMKDEFGVRLGVVFLDTITTAFMVEDENDNSVATNVMAQVRGIADKSGTVVVPVHHFGKSPTTGLRGASAWRATADAVLAVLGDRNEQTGDVKDRALAVSKLRDGVEGPLAPFALREIELGTDRDGDPWTTCVVCPALGEAVIASVSKRQRKMSANATMALTALRKAVEDAGSIAPASNHIPSGTKVVPELLWSEYAFNSGLGAGDEPKRKNQAFSRARDKLIEAGAVCMWNEYVWIGRGV
jgi:hypothetical protein